MSASSIAAVSQPELWYAEVGVLCFLFYPQMAAFLPLFYLPFPQIICLLHQFLEALVISKRRVSPSLANLWVIPQRHSVTLAIRIMVEEELVFSYIKHWKMTFVTLRNLKNRILGLGYKDTDGLVAYIHKVFIALFQTLAVLVVWWGSSHRSVWANGSISFFFSILFLPHKILNQSFYNIGQSQNFFSWG